MSRRNDNEWSEMLAEMLRRQIRTGANKRLLRALPVFRVESELSPDLKKMLRRLKREETRALAKGRR
jgi:hypothetical protein